ncbi:MAG: hypothetical protein SVY10_18405, partial [Thermodesulfobacteriota bacterium]|nr:hypothetical protein [Thermodesulfobacteriota bacterium]
AISDPSEGSIHAEGDIIAFDGSGVDNEDGILTGSSLVWNSSIDGQIGEGTFFTTSDLSTGTHIITLTVTDSGGATGQDSINITVEQGDSVDSDEDGMPDWWEEQNGLNPEEDDANVDTDDDSLDNLEEYQYGTHPNNPDTDNDSLPDGWEVNYGLDPNDNSGENGGQGDFDNDGWTNYEEYINFYDPTVDTSPAPTPPQIVETIPHDGAGIYDTTRIPNNTSFAVRMQDDDGMDITDVASIQFTITIGEDSYIRDINSSDVVRIKNLTSEEDTRITELWAVYDRSKDTDGVYPFDTEVNIMVDARDCRGDWMVQESYSFRVETESHHEDANDPANLPTTEETSTGDMTTITLVTNDGLNGIQIVYNTDEPIKPQVGPYDEIPPLNTKGVKSLGYPINLQPPTVFNNPVTIIIPYNDKGTPRKSKIYMHNGVEWVYACSSYNSHGVIQPDGEGWVVPGSLVCDEDADPPTLEVQICHFTGVQTGFTDEESGDNDNDISGLNDDSNNDGSNSGSAGGCFITNAKGSSSPSWEARILYPITLLLILIMACSAVVYLWRMKSN